MLGSLGSTGGAAAAAAAAATAAAAAATPRSHHLPHHSQAACSSPGRSGHCHCLGARCSLAHACARAVGAGGRAAGGGVWCRRARRWCSHGRCLPHPARPAAAARLRHVLGLRDPSGDAPAGLRLRPHSARHCECALGGARERRAGARARALARLAAAALSCRRYPGAQRLGAHGLFSAGRLRPACAHAPPLCLFDAAASQWHCFRHAIFSGVWAWHDGRRRRVLQQCCTCRYRGSAGAGGCAGGWRHGLWAGLAVRQQQQHGR